MKTIPIITSCSILLLLLFVGCNEEQNDSYQVIEVKKYDTTTYPCENCQLSSKKCSKLRTGKFYEVFNDDTSLIYRDSNIQLTIFKGDSLVTNLKWVDSCSFEVSFNSSSSKEFESYFKDKVLIARIVGVNDEYYTYKVKQLNVQEPEISGKMYFGK
ncbi:MAG: hypothetical protein R2799_05600 [Crocinitomicaceae bacterium]